MTKIAILGGGSWGTALAIVLSRSRKAHDISLWVHNAGLAESIRRERENKTYLPGSKLPESVGVHSQLEAALSGAQVILGAMPSAHARSVYASALSFFASNASFVSASKGLEPSTHLRMSEVIAQVVSTKFAPRIAVISGPSFAVEAARGEPTAMVVTSLDGALATELQEEFAGPNFRLYTNDDVLGVELAGAMKNVVAIAAGACQGLGLGSNALAALITRGGATGDAQRSGRIGRFGSHLHRLAQPQSLRGNRTRQRTTSPRNPREYAHGRRRREYGRATAGAGARTSDQNADHGTG